MESSKLEMNEEKEHDDQEKAASMGIVVVRSYECVFCKRGFNTAQALGGHMNIHRKKDRPNNKPPAAKIDPNKQLHQVHSSGHDQYRNIDDHQPNLTFEFSTKDLEMEMEMSRQILDHQKEELDLELRLGYNN